LVRRRTAFTSPGGNPMLKWYRTHQEQIKNVAQNLKELYYAPRPGPQPAVRPKSEQKGRGSRSGGLAETRRHEWKAHPVTTSVREKERGSRSQGTSLLMMPAMRCCRCNTWFPRADYLYTKKSGLCISCWEAKVV
jgi:hypothetical protein